MVDMDSLIVAMEISNRPVSLLIHKDTWTSIHSVVVQRTFPCRCGSINYEKSSNMSQCGI